MKSILFALVSSCTWLASACALTNDQWQSTSSSDFDTMGNWSLNAVPTAANVALFPSTAGLQNTVNVSAATTIGDLYFNASAPSYTLTSSAGATLTVDQDTDTNVTELSDNSVNTQQLNGTYILQNSGGTSAGVQFALTAGTLVFGSTSNLTINQTTSESNSGGNLTINGAFTLAANTNLNWNPTSGTLTYNPSSQTIGSGAQIESTKAGSTVYLQQSVGTAFKDLFIGGSSNTAGAVYLNVDGLTVSTPVLMNPTNTSVTGGTYTLGMNASGTAAGIVSGKITLYNATSSTATDDFDVAAGNTMTISGQIVNSVAGATGSNDTITKTSTGNLILTNTTNTFTSPVQVNAGTLLVNGVTAAGSAFTVSNSGSLLGGTGTIGGTVSIGAGSVFTAGTRGTGGTIAPGNVGLLTTGALTLTSTAVFHADISDANGIAGTSYDQVSTPGVTLGSSTLELNIASGLTFTPGQALVLISNTGASAISGTFAGLAQGGTVTADGYSFTVNYAGGDGNDFELDVVPEPSALAGLIFLSFLVLCHRGRKLRA